MFKIPPDIEQAINQAAANTGVDPALLKSFAYVESKFNCGAQSHTKVQGLFQIQQSTWQEYRGAMAYSLLPYEQAYTAALILKKLGKKYNNNLALMAIAYNSGGAVANKLVGKDLNLDNVRQAVSSMSAYWAKYHINPNQKAKEAYDYFGRIGKALATELGKDIHEVVGHLASNNTTSKVQEVRVASAQKTLEDSGFDQNPKHTMLEQASNSPTTQKAIAELSKTVLNLPPIKLDDFVTRLIGPSKVIETWGT